MNLTSIQVYRYMTRRTMIGMPAGPGAASAPGFELEFNLYRD